MSHDPDVLVVGAGLAGLNAARVLARAGLAVVVLEAADEPGGRVRTSSVDGFLVDEGFQVLNPAYPELQRAVDVDALRLLPFGRGVAVRTDDGLAVLADPSRHPGHLAGALASGLVTPAQLAALSTWYRQARGARDRSLAASLDAAGFHGPLRSGVLEPFLAGVLADDTGATSAGFARHLAYFFLHGTPGLPADGMAALPRLLATGLAVETGHRVEAIAREGSGWRVDAASGTRRARAVVVATDPVAAAELVGGAPPAMRGLATWWFAADTPPSEWAFLHVDAQRVGPVVNTVVISNAAPSYAPPGRHLVEASALLGAEPPTEADVRDHVARIYATDAAGWEVVANQEIQGALPAIEPGADPPAWRDLGDGLVVVGDAADASIQGALASGRRAAERLVEALGGRSDPVAG